MVLKKSGAWRLFLWMSRDFYRNADTMSKPDLTLKIRGNGVGLSLKYSQLTNARIMPYFFACIAMIYMTTVEVE
ncbi:hypothetical protein IBT49_16080 [Erwinia sp. S63]|uniref:hypothetical protein n=1 Tax=Erwinia sp. S63 TaxID=2769341 RepID=UPI00190C921A|nr:hypothetical protein [Erwinia sp. S63]MBK0097504.1 hypothetical protein [Erwinia sp. S63]